MKFTLKEKSILDAMFISLEYMGGDADTSEFQKIKLDILFSEWENHKDEINKEVLFYKEVKKCLEGNYDSSYDDIAEEWGEDIADFIDGNVPGDPTCDYQWKCTLDTISVIGYDKEGNLYESYV